ncbi:hypothetical protein MLD38_020205 [Melastoma candidum]|uniref:Uncharacterized protein n=1 Tax=Melastoma candidum TaxID=119954 RepID=A0ACB9QCH7_9MYRT|nr:hypothetical protein MLD38_020205 [Melastoma candidum]
MQNFSPADRQRLSKLPFTIDNRAEATLQGEFESVHRDLLIGFSATGFDPLDLDDPFPDNQGSIHVWQGDEDLLVPVTVQRHIVRKLPWIRYHEIPGAGHLFPHADGMADTIFRELLVGGETAT